MPVPYVPRFLCIAGGSGSGKSTLAGTVLGYFGHAASLLALDDYQKPKDDVPRTPSGRPNHDHPDAIDWPRFLADLAALKRGESVTLRRRVKHTTIDAGVRDGEKVVIEPRPLVIVEGFLALWHPVARAAYAGSIFLEAPPELRVERRRWAKDPAYVTDVLLPMHEEHVEPTKWHANLLLNVEPLAPDQVFDTVMPFVVLALRGKAF